MVENALSLCSLHRKLLDSGVLGLTEDYRVLVSMYFVARSDTGQRMGCGSRRAKPAGSATWPPKVLVDHIGWHTTQVFKALARVA
jgi:putative restriction endonuclease